MKAKTFEAQYKVVDFNLYKDNEEDEAISIVDFVIESDDIDYVTEEFSNIFVIENDNRISYLFADYKLSECYKVGDGLIRIICIK